MLLEYSLGEERSYLWAVTKTGITSYELPKREEMKHSKGILSTAQQPRLSLGTSRGLGVEGRPGSSLDTNEVATKLSQMLLAPVAAQLRNKRLLMLVMVRAVCALRCFAIPQTPLKEFPMINSLILWGRRLA
jgi:hypothetical protein